MYKQLIAAAAISAIYAGTVWADSHGKMEDKYLKECQRYAEEDKVSAEDMESYIEQCLKDIGPPEEGGSAEMESKEPPKE